MLFVPHCFKTQEMCDGMVRKGPWSLRYVPDHLKTQDMSDEAVQMNPWLLGYVSDHFKMQELIILKHGRGVQK